MIKDMERSVFKRETIQLKYLPKVEKKNAQDKCKFYFLIYDDFSISIPRKTVKTNCQFEVNIETYNGEHNEAGLVNRIKIEGAGGNQSRHSAEQRRLRIGRSNEPAKLLLTTSSQNGQIKSIIPTDGSSSQGSRLQ